MTNYPDYEDYQIITKVTEEIIFSLKIKPDLNVGLVFGISESFLVKEAIQHIVNEQWIHYVDKLPCDSTGMFQLAGRMGLDINHTLTDFYQGFGWQHVPEYPGL